MKVIKSLRAHQAERRGVERGSTRQAGQARLINCWRVSKIPQKTRSQPVTVPSQSQSTPDGCGILPQIEDGNNHESFAMHAVENAMWKTPHQKATKFA